MLESISLEVANYWASNDFLTESNKNCGTLVAFDWRKNYLSEINTNIDLSDLEIDNFKFDVFVEFFKENNFTFVLGLRNISYTDNPSPEWTEKLKEILDHNEINYDEYLIDHWPSPIPEFDVPDNIFILRYTYDEYSKIDKFAAHNSLFRNWLKKTDWEEYYRESEFDQSDPWKSYKKERVIVFCSDIENLILHEGFDK